MLSALRLYNFRNYEDSKYSFAPGINGIFGPNGSGKTNVLEALSLLSTGRSFRNGTLEEMIRYEQSRFIVDARLQKGDLLTKITLSYEGDKKEARINSNHYAYFSSVLGHFPLVLYAPRDMNIITAAPAERRRFWNVLLSQASPLYLHHLTRYTRALKQRNTLLKKKKGDQLEVWNAQLAHSGIFLIRTRRGCIEMIAPLLQKYFDLLSPQQQAISIHYEPSINTQSEEGYLHELHRMTERDILYQTTNYGPHRDDFSIQLDKRLAKTYASEGQKRTCIAALKCAEWTLLDSQADTSPLLCIDDCPAHLDDERTNRFINTLLMFPQVLITAPSMRPFPLDLFSNQIETTHSTLNPL